MQRVEKIHESKILPWNEVDVQVVHESGQSHPEVIPHHEQALDVRAVALP